MPRYLMAGYRRMRLRFISRAEYASAPLSPMIAFRSAACRIAGGAQLRSLCAQPRYSGEMPFFDASPFTRCRCRCRFTLLKIFLPSSSMPAPRTMLKY